MAKSISSSRDEKRSVAAAVIAGMFAAFLALPITATILFGLFPPTGWLNDGPAVFNLPYLAGYFAQLGWAGLTDPTGGWREITHLWWALQSDATIAFEMNWRAYAIELAALAAGLAGGVLVFLTSRPVDIRVHLRGRRFYWGKAALGSAATRMNEEMRKSGRGITLAPGLAISKLRELLNILLVGAPGSGKTRIILFLIEQILKVVRAAPNTMRLLIHDTTGEIYRGLPLKDDEFAVIGLQRRDGWAWAIGRDVRNLQDATALAERLVRPNGKQAGGENRVFDNGAVLCMTGCIELARHRHGADWGAHELLEIALSDPIDLLAEFRRVYPPAASVFMVENGGDINRTSASFILTFRANVGGLLTVLARAWQGVKPNRYFSFTEWLDGTGTQPGVVVLQRSARYARVSSAWMGAVLDLVADHACDEEYNEDRRMRTYLVLDEIFQLQAAMSEAFQQILDVGRNKNVSTIAAYQDLNQARIVGGDDAAKAFRARFQTRIFGQMPEGEDGAGEVSRMIGERTIEVAATKAGDRPTEKQVPVIDQLMISDRLGVIDDEVVAVAVGMGDVVELRWPVTVWPKIRPVSTKPRK